MTRGVFLPTAITLLTVFASAVNQPAGGEQGATGASTNRHRRDTFRTNETTPWLVANNLSYFDATFNTIEAVKGSFMCSMRILRLFADNNVTAQIVNGEVEVDENVELANITELEEGTQAYFNRTLLEQFINQDFKPSVIAWPCPLAENCCGAGCCPLEVNPNREAKYGGHPWMVIDNTSFFDQTNTIVLPHKGNVGCALRTSTFVSENAELDEEGVIVVFDLASQHLFAENVNITDTVAVNKSILSQLIHSPNEKPAEIGWSCLQGLEHCCGTTCCPIVEAGTAFRVSVLSVFISLVMSLIL